MQQTTKMSVCLCPKSKEIILGVSLQLACSKRSDSGERCEVKIAIKSRGGLGREVSPYLAFIFFALLFTSHRSPLSERLEQATLQHILLQNDHEYKHLSI